ncbi:MAG: hypothetical protein RL115_257, partial [Bacteroidota bacterium]
MKNINLGKFKLRIVLLLCLFFAMQNKIKAQTTLAAGDILFTGYNALGIAPVPDTFSFVVLTPIQAGTIIYFTERGYQGALWQTSGGTEGTISWTTAASLTIGQEVEIAGLGNTAASVNGTPNGTVAQVAGGNATSGLSLANTGDQIIAFQGGSGDPTNNAATMISGISWTLACGTTTISGWNTSGCTYGPQSSAMPPGLTGGIHAFLAGTPGTSPNNDHGRFNCNGTPYSSVAALKSAIMNNSNWLHSNTGLSVYDIPTACTYITSCAAPTISTHPFNRSICINGNTNFAITASGATAYQWQVNTSEGFVNISNNTLYSGATTSTLTITGASAIMNGYIYRCIVSDGSCVTNSNSGTLTVANINSSYSHINVSCFGGTNGTASVTPSGGTAPYTYSWSPSGGTAATATGLAAGTYTVTITDANSCTATRPFIITQPSAISVTTAQVNVSCFGGTNGSASVTPSGGTPSYTYSWAPSGGTGATATGLVAGNYTVTITDANACIATRPFNITQPSTPVTGTRVITNVACYGGNTGAINLTPSGGTPGYTFNWGGGITTEDRTGLVMGAYSVIITDANGCTGTVNSSVSQPAALTVTAASQTNVSCNGGTNGTASINTPTGGSGSYTYNWTPGNPTGDGTTSVSGLTAGTWTCTVTDANLCTAQ